MTSPSPSHALALALCAVMLAGTPLALVAATIPVDTLADEFNTGASCSLREAVQSANTNADFGGCAHSGTYGTDTIQLSNAGFYTLSRINATDEDANSTSDLDITGNLTIQGPGASTTSIGNLSGNYSGRIVHVLAGATVTISGVTLRDGNLPNQAAGAGLRSEPSSNVTLNNVTVAFNDANGNAGGILNRATMVLNGSLVSGNRTLAASLGGGGIFSSPNTTLTLNDSRVLNNRTQGNGANGSGAGIYADTGTTVTLNNSTVDGNEIQIGGVIGSDVIGNGGGIFSRGRLTLVQSTISNNVAAGNDSRGGGIYCDPEGLLPIVLDRTLVFANDSACNPDVEVGNELCRGGGMYGEPFCDIVIRDSIFSANSAQGNGGGLYTDRSDVLAERSLFVGNIARDSGGGISSASFNIALVNTTLLNNEAGDSGGGAFFSETGSSGALSAQVSSCTVVGNVSNAIGTFPDSGGGGGMRSAGTNLVAVRNTVIAGNLADNGADGNDCIGEFSTKGNLLVQDAGDCTLLDAGATVLLNTNALLAAATNNGGLLVGASNGTQAGMLTRAPASNSPLVDAGNSSGCKDGNGTLLETDQIGRGRSQDGPDADTEARCDIGAIEFGIAAAIFKDSFE